MGFSGQEYGSALLQGIFLTQGLNPGLLDCRQIFYHLSHRVLVLICNFFFFSLRVNLISHCLNFNPQSVFPFLGGIIRAGYYFRTEGWKPTVLGSSPDYSIWVSHLPRPPLRFLEGVTGEI